MSTSVSTSNDNLTAKTGSKPNKSADQTIKILIIIAASVVLLVVGFFVIRIQGWVRGAEFSPTHFQQRDFSFYEIPLIHLQITPIRRSGSTPNAANFLRQKGLITAPLGQPAYWHLVSMQRGFADPSEADAKLLVDQLELEHNGALYWQKWTNDHPKSASIVWPIIQKLAERELYILIPRIFEIAQLEQASIGLQTKLDDYLVTQYRSLIQELVAADRAEVASQLVDEATADFPDAAPWKSYLAESNP